MKDYSQRVEVWEDLKLSDAAELQKISQLFDQITLGYLGLPDHYTPYQRARATEPLANDLFRFYELDKKVKEAGYKSLATAVYGLLKTKSTKIIPREWAICPPNLRIGISPDKGQKRYEKNVLPIYDALLDDPLCNEADWEIANEWRLTLSYEELMNSLYELQHRENCGEFDEEMQEVKVIEELEKRLFATKERRGLLPAPPLPLLAAGIEEDESDEEIDQSKPTSMVVPISWINTDEDNAASNADKDLANKQIASLSDEELELYAQIEKLTSR